MTDLNAKIIPLKTEVEGRSPDASVVDVGEIAVNLTDRKIFSKRSDGTVVVLAGGSKIQDSEDFRPILLEPDPQKWNEIFYWTVFSTGNAYGWDYSGDGAQLSFNSSAYDRQGIQTNVRSYFKDGVDSGKTSLFVSLENPWADTSVSVTWYELEFTSSQFANPQPYNYFFGCTPFVQEIRDAHLASEPVWITFEIPGKSTPQPLSDWDLIRWNDNLGVFNPATPDQLWVEMDKGLQDLSDVANTIPADGDGLLWDAFYEVWKPAKLPNIELIERQVPSYRWTLAPGANPEEGQYRVASDGLSLNKIDADGNNLVNWFNYYPDTSGDYWWSTDDLNWTKASYDSKSDNGQHLQIYSTDVLPSNPAEIYIALGPPNTIEQLPLNEGDLIQWDGDAWVPINITDLAVDITQFGIGDLKDVDTTTSPPTNGQVLTWDDTAKLWKAAPAAEGKSNFYELNDVSVGGVTDGQMVAWSFSDSAWVPVDPPTSGIGEAPDLELDGALETGDVLVYDAEAEKWKPKQEADLEIDLSRYALGDLSDVDTATVPPALGEALLFDGTKWLPGTVQGGDGGGSGGGWMGNRSDDTYTSPELEPQGIDNLALFQQMGQSGQFVSITVSQPSWVRLYATAQARIDDAGRSLGTDPLPGSGVLLEVNTTSADETVPITPGAVYYNNDPIPSSKIYATISNFSAKASVVVTVTCIAQTFFDVIDGGTFGSGR